MPGRQEGLGAPRPPAAAWCAAAVFGCALLAACTPHFDWRLARSADGGFAADFPGPPRVEQRDVDFDGRRVPMSMTSAGVDLTLFAVAVARLPPDALDRPAAIQHTLDWFRDRLVHNLGGELTTVSTLAPDPALDSMRAGIAFTASAPPVPGRDAPTRLAARLVVADDRIYQVAVMWSDGRGSSPPPEALETFFSSFRLAR